MTLRRTGAENLATTMLARDGIAAIWILHLAAARAYRDGHRAAAGVIDRDRRGGRAGVAAARGRARA